MKDVELSIVVTRPSGTTTKIRSRKVKPAIEVTTRYYPQRKVNGYGVVYWVVVDSEEDACIPGRMPDELAATNVAHLLNTGGERGSCAKL
jgi:hypothetical protein